MVEAAVGRSAIVVGAGIGGLAVTRGLAESGWQVRVYEQPAAFGAVGAGLAIEPNAVRALDWLGLGQQLRARGMRQGPAGLRTARGRWLVRTRLEELEERFGTPAFELHRADVHEILAEGLAENPAVTLHTRHRAVTVTASSKHAAVTFQGPAGPVTAEADLVVAADGVHSATRSALFPHHPAPAYAGYITWRAIVPAEEAADITLDAAVVESWGRGRRVGIVPLPDGRVYWFFTESAPEGAQQDTTVTDLANRVAGWHPPIPQLLSATPPRALLRNDIHTMAAPLPSYRRGRVVLLGDAAHAMPPDLGQGAALALEDAVTLAIYAGHATSDPDLDAGLDRYDRERRPRTQRLVRISAFIGRIGQARNPLTVAARNLAAGVLPASAYLRASAGAFSWIPPTREDTATTQAMKGGTTVRRSQPPGGNGRH
jgi:2-polyprenyl-6-methoxyphenol hydroxylase-like FAD-dependent oxidoreductase